MITRPLFLLTPSGLAAYIRIVSSDTEQTQNSKPETRRTYHWKVRPSAAKALALYARRNGLLIGGAIEQAIDLLVSPHGKNT